MNFVCELPLLCLIVFPIVVHTQEEPSPETQDNPSPEKQDEPSPETQDNPSPETQDHPSPETQGDPNPDTQDDPRTRIVGGSEATRGQFPYQVLLLLSHQNYR